MVPNVNVNVNVDFCFRISCELGGRLNILGFLVNLSGLTIAKSQALGIVYCKNSGAVEWVFSEGGSFSWVGARTKGVVHKGKLTKNMSLHSDLFTSLIYCDLFLAYF